ncbi:hypothetical protein [Crossiella cryophila]|uniref:Uncharacterized protein n=1 Tax=Crossiella cryophila TaxID=43355 RepID=A0A7W7CBI4_9PSEU|nr:hypothetical protein [Crossiella cryophila]MBB4678073.1 hypothetical protein [Crossiella cryophila]
MASVTLRDFVWTVDPKLVGVEGISAELRPRTRKIDINIARLVRINTLATSCPARFDSYFPEARILLSYLDTPLDGPLRLRPDVTRTSSHHIRHFVVESLGLAMLTAAVEASGRWHRRGSLHHLDALPIGPGRSYRKPGIKPDLLFGWPKRRLAGEARGRYRKAPSRALAANLRRLDELLRWSQYHQDHPFVMSWAYANEQEITVDLFVPRNKPRQPAGQADDTAQDADGTSQKVGVLANESQVEQNSWRQDHPVGIANDDWTPVSWLAERAQGQVASVQETLFTTAPPVGRRVSGRRLHGAWAPLDLFGRADRRLAFGLLHQDLSPGEQSEMVDRVSRRTDGNPGTALDISGRLVVLVTSDTDGDPWDLLADRE